MLPHCELTETLTEQAGATVRVYRSASGHDRAGWRHALLRMSPGRSARRHHRATARQ